MHDRNWIGRHIFLEVRELIRMLGRSQADCLSDGTWAISEKSSCARTSWSHEMGWIPTSQVSGSQVRNFDNCKLRFIVKIIGLI